MVARFTNRISGAQMEGKQMSRGPYKLSVKPKTIVGERLAIIREENHLTMCQMARDLKMYHHDIHRWLTHYEYPNAINIMMICRTYNVSADWLLGLSDERELRGGQHEFND